MGDELTEIHGTCAPGFEPVRQAFAANFAERGEIGASVAVVARGEPVVNLWAGWANPAKTQAWQQDTLTNVWSTTKAVTSLCAHLLIDRGELDPDAPVARYWPEFAQAGKGDIPVRWIMSHKSGLTGLVVPASVADYYDWDKITDLLAQQEPLFPPGTATGYQAITFGYLVGEVIRRITGQSCGQLAAAGPDRQRGAGDTGGQGQFTQPRLPIRFRHDLLADVSQRGCGRRRRSGPSCAGRRPGSSPSGSSRRQRPDPPLGRHRPPIHRNRRGRTPPG